MYPNHEMFNYIHESGQLVKVAYKRAHIDTINVAKNISYINSIYKV